MSIQLVPYYEQMKLALKEHFVLASQLHQPTSSRERKEMAVLGFLFVSCSFFF